MRLSLIFDSLYLSRIKNTFKMIKKYLFQTTAIVLLSVTSLVAQDYTALLKDNLIATRSADGLEPADVSELSIYNQSTSRTSGVEHVYAVQKYNGIEVFNANVAAAFRGESLVHVGASLITGISDKVVNTAPTLSPVEAATAAAAALGAGTANFTVLETTTANQVLLNQGGVSYDNVPVKLVYQLTDNEELKLAWDLSIHMTNQAHWYSVRVDAVTGEILSQNDWIVSCTFESHTHKAMAVQQETQIETIGFKQEKANTALAGEQYNVFPMPLESPNHGANELVADPQDLTASPFGWHDTDGVEGAEFTITRGNNVYAQTDFDDNLNTNEDSPEGGAELNFDFEYQFDSAPINMVEAVTTNLFYWNNILHDVMYQYGFDEVSGNFQQTNYTGEGLAGDFVVAGSQVGTVQCNDPNTNCLNNATFGTPPDGLRPGMRMFLFSASGEPGDALTINGGTLDGSYQGVPALFGDPLPEDTPLTGNLALTQDDNAGNSTDDIDACDAITNGTELEGNIAVIRRGSCEFGVKVLAAETEGAVAVIVVNNEATDPIQMAAGAVGDQVTIPSIMVSQANGEAIIAALQAGETINVSIVNAGPFQLDGSVDNGIIAHEYGHGISNRLTAGPNNVNCLFNAESMGEGWSDWYGLMFTMTEDDFAEEARGIGTYASGQPTTGGGIRPRPYSTDFAVNELTYGDTNNTGAISQPHGIGTVWATMIWDLTWMLIDEYGFDADLYNGTAGNNIALQVVTDGLKLQACSPGFVDGRDGILAAIEINQMIPDEDRDDILCAAWGVFANRGLGVSAEQGSKFDRTDQVEAFDTPSVTDETSPCFDSLSTDEFATNNFSIFPNPSNGQITINMTTSLGEGQVQIIDLNGRVVFAQDARLEGAMNIDASGLAKGVYLVQVANQTVSETAKLIIR